MIKTEQIRLNGVGYTRTYSDQNMMIERDGAVYSEAIDPIGSGRTYTESNIPISEEGEDEAN